eukprot:jgi/Botrbrau1/22513/Bobra.114_2s0038.1
MWTTGVADVRILHVPGEMGEDFFEGALKCLEANFLMDTQGVLVWRVNGPALTRIWRAMVSSLYDLRHVYLQGGPGMEGERTWNHEEMDGEGVGGTGSARHDHDLHNNPQMHDMRAHLGGSSEEESMASSPERHDRVPEGEGGRPDQEAWMSDFESDTSVSPDHSDSEAAAATPRERSYEYYKQNMQEPLWVVGNQVSRLNLAQGLYERLTLKQREHKKDNHFDEDMRRQRDLHSPQPNNWPGSLYLCKKLVDCNSAKDNEFHACKNHCHIFPQIPPTDYEAHREDRCPHCQERRFVVIKEYGKQILSPQNIFWSFGADTIIQLNMFGNPNFCRVRGSGRADPEDYYNSEECKRLYEAAFPGEGAAKWADRSISFYEVGLDWFEPFGGKTHSVGIVTLSYGITNNNMWSYMICKPAPALQGVLRWFRCADIGAANKCKVEFCFILGVIPGPSAPKSMDAYLEHFLQPFMRFGPGSQGLPVCNTSQNEDGSPVRQEFQHVILLSAVYGDSPGLAKVANCIGASGKRGCFFCTIPGEYVPENHHVYFAAYNEPVESMVKTDEGWRVEAVKCGDPRARL